MSRPAVGLLLVSFVAPLQATAAYAAGTLLLPVVDTPTSGGGSVVLEPVEPRAQPARRLVFSCVTPGQVTFSDRPCGPAPTVRELRVEAPAVDGAGDAPDTTKRRTGVETSKRPAPAREDSAAGDAAAARAKECQNLQATLDEVDARMRAGYSAHEAGRLWQRWREVKARLRDARC